MEDRYSFFNKGSGGVWRSFRNGDFQEEDVWAVLDGRKDSDLIIGTPNQFSANSNGSPRILTSASRVIPKPYKRTSSSHDDGKVVQHSAPVNIPDWSKVYGKGSNEVSKKTSWRDADDDDDCLHHGGDSDEDDNLWDEDDYDGKLPPHEFLARRFSRSQISTFSVLEGVGRTLKGRDLSKVRNAILTKTGFLE